MWSASANGFFYRSSLISAYCMWSLDKLVMLKHGEIYMSMVNLICSMIRSMSSICKEYIKW